MKSWDKVAERKAELGKVRLQGDRKRRGKEEEVRIVFLVMEIMGGGGNLNWWQISVGGGEAGCGGGQTAAWRGTPCCC